MIRESTGWYELDGQDGSALDAVATLIAREHCAAGAQAAMLPTTFLDPQHCRHAIVDLLADGFAGVTAVADGACVGVMCGRTEDGVGVLPAHGIAVDPDRPDPTAIVVGLFAELAPVLLADGARRFTVDQVPLAPLGTALSNLGFGRAGVFAAQRPSRLATGAPAAVRIAAPDDLDTIAALSQIELDHRATPPIYAPGRRRSLADTRELHERLLRGGAVHFLGRRDGIDVGLLTMEFTSPAPRLCQPGQPYIGATATDPAARGTGIGKALVHAALDWAAAAGHQTVSVDFDSPNPLSRPFWLGVGFQPTGYRLRRFFDIDHLPRPVGARRHRPSPGSGRTLLGRC